MRLRFLSWTQILLISGLVLSLAACTKDKGGTGPEAANPVTLVREGWSAFEALDYSGALALFQASLNADGSQTPDAYSGAGWSSYMLGEVTDARMYWETGLEQDAASFDIRAGLGFLEFWLENYADAVDQFNSLLEDNSNYHFVHMEGLDYLDVRVTMAEAYYLQGMMEESLGQVQLLNPLFMADINTSEGVAELIAEIERLNDVYRG